MTRSNSLVTRSTSLLCFLIFMSCADKQEDRGSAPAVPVKVIQLSYDSENARQEYVGVVESDHAVDVSFLVPGTIEHLYISEGQKVVTGQLLASLNNVSLKSAHTLSLATLEQARDAYKRLSAMYENKSLPEIQFIDAKTKLEQAQAAESITRKSLQDGNIYAPQSGIIGKRFLEPGATVMPGLPVYTIMDIDRVKVKVAIPEGEISGIRTGERCEVKISALDNKSFEGSVLEKGVSANPTSHTYDIKVTVRNDNGKIMPGMVCRTYLYPAANKNEQSIVVPVKAVQVDYSGARFVWLRDKTGKATYRQVTLGSLSENGVRIRSGLQPGEELIVEGYQNISAGTPVSVQKTIK